MADSTIANLTSGSPAQSTDQVPIQRGSSTLKLTAGDIAALAGGSPIAGAWMKYDGHHNSGVDAAVNSGVIFLCPIEVDYDISVSQLIHSTTTDNTNNYDFGIYDRSGNLVVHTGPVHLSSATSVHNLIGGLQTITKGNYLYAITVDVGFAATLYVERDSAGAGIHIFGTSNTSTGGTLPSTITLTTSVTQGFAYRPIMILQ
jgi:hypothetical protein